MLNNWNMCRLSPPPRLAESSLQQLVPQLTTAQEGAAALLIQVKADTQQDLQDIIKRAQEVLSSSGTKFGGQTNQPLGVESYPFSTDPQVGPCTWHWMQQHIIQRSCL